MLIFSITSNIVQKQNRRMKNGDSILCNPIVFNCKGYTIKFIFLYLYEKSCDCMRSIFKSLISFFFYFPLLYLQVQYIVKIENMILNTALFFFRRTTLNCNKSSLQSRHISRISCDVSFIST